MRVVFCRCHAFGRRLSHPHILFSSEGIRMMNSHSPSTVSGVLPVDGVQAPAIPSFGHVTYPLDSPFILMTSIANVIKLIFL